jgi:hypothetical protein
MTNDFRLDAPMHAHPTGRITLRESGAGTGTLILPPPHETHSESQAVRDMPRPLTMDMERVPGVEVVLELTGKKMTTLLSDLRPLPVEEEGLLLEHAFFPAGSHFELTLTADNHDVVKEEFRLPTALRDSVMEAHRKLAELNSEFLSDPRMLDTAMSVYFPELAEEYDLWYKISISADRRLMYALHIGPSHHQEIKKRIEGSLVL